MNTKIRAKFGKVHNRFDVFVKNTKTGEERQVAKAENLVLDNFMDLLYYIKQSNGFDNINYGTGSGELDPARTTLFTHLSAKSVSNLTETFDAESGIYSMRGDITMIETEHVGSVLTEVGIGLNGTIYTHALLTDMNGNPVSIEKTNTDIITIYATVYLVVDIKTLAEQGLVLKPYHGSSVNNSNGFRHWVLRGYASYWGTSRCGLPIQGPCRIPDIEVGSTYEGTYTGSSAELKKMQFNVARIPAAVFNSSSGIWGFETGTYAGVTHYDFWYTKILGVKDAEGFDIVGEELGNGDGIETDFNTYWFMADIDKVYVDGVEVVSGVTKRSRTKPSTTMNSYLGFLAINTDGDESLHHGYIPYPGQTTTAAGLYCTVYYENLISEYCGVVSMLIGKYAQIYASDDFVTWVLIDESTSAEKTVNVPEAYQHYKYWKRVSVSALSTAKWTDLVTDDNYANNVVFDTPPGLVTDEEVGTGDGAEDDFVLDHAPIAGSLTVYVDDVEETEYVLDGAQITFNAGHIPGVGAEVTADYRYACTITADYNTLVCPKDSNHVLDYSYTIYYDRYTEEY